ncbi:DUF4357 domain-containing protein [Campylobacter hominis]|uniref:DUF4357 domain-containing protein n=1 Tax=Campylobacter hominis TaxID=76517 RepID=UPI003CCFEDD2
MLLNSSSYAAAFVLGTNANGKTHWKTENGISLKDLEENEITGMRRYEIAISSFFIPFI